MFLIVISTSFFFHLYSLLILAKENQRDRTLWQYWNIDYSNSILRDTSRDQTLIFYQTILHINHPGELSLQLINIDISTNTVRHLVHFQFSVSYYLGLTYNFYFHVPWKANEHFLSSLLDLNIHYRQIINSNPYLLSVGIL